MGIGLLLAAAGGVRGADEAPKTAADTMNRVFDLLKAGDVDAAAKYAPPGMDVKEATEELKRVANELKRGEFTVGVAESKENGDLAAVIAKAVRMGQSDFHNAFAMMRKEGMWRFYPRIDDLKLEGAAKERMDVLWTWAQSRREKLNMDSQKVGGPNMPLAMDDFKQTKEWKALNRYVGTWDDQATVTIPAPSQLRSSGTAAWALGGRFLQGKSKGDDNSESMNLFTYDPNRRAVRAWWFSSLGYTSVSTGDWDEATSTFTFKADDSAPMTVIMTDHFIDDDHREYKVTTQDVDGKVVFQMSAKSTRQKK
jgi:hypothetical protein